MRRPTTEVVQVGLRIRESLRRKLASEAERHRVSLNQEITLRLHDSFEKTDAPRTLHDITRHMSLVWTRLATHLEASELEKRLSSAVLQNKDPKEIVKLLRDWLLHREIERRMIVDERLFPTAGMPSAGDVP